MYGLKGPTRQYIWEIVERNSSRGYTQKMKGKKRKALGRKKFNKLKRKGKI